MQTERLQDSCDDQQVLVENLTEQLKIKEETIYEEEEQHDDHDEHDDDEHDNDEDDDEDDDEEEEFSFACGIDAPPVAADEVFYNGQIRPLFPLFNQKLMLSEVDLENLKERSPVKKVFIQTEDNSPATSSSESQEIEGPYCEWSKNKAIEASPETCKKSNSTGFSKLWRFKDLLHRSNSDGRDAFVYLNPKVEEKVDRKIETPGEVKVNGEAKKVTLKKKKKVGVKKSEGVLAAEAYMKSKAKGEDRRRSYLPYRPELVGFFTNVNGGLTRNVHPF